MFPTREDALCSGAGAGFPDVYRGQAAGVASRPLQGARHSRGATAGGAPRRLQAAVDSGATPLVTTCPHAEMHLEGIARDRNMQISILDLAQVVAQGLEASPPPVPVPVPA